MKREAILKQLPHWAQPNLDELDRILNGPTDEDIEHALFGVRSLHGTIMVDAADIVWDPRRQGPYEEVLQEVEENPDDYDTRDPLILDLMDDGTLVLNDGHHRFAKGSEEGMTSFPAEIQFSPGQARKYLTAIRKRR